MTGEPLKVAASQTDSRIELEGGGTIEHVQINAGEKGKVNSSTAKHGDAYVDVRAGLGPFRDGTGAVSSQPSTSLRAANAAQFVQIYKGPGSKPGTIELSATLQATVPHSPEIQIKYATTTGDGVCIAEATAFIPTFRPDGIRGPSEASDVTQQAAATMSAALTTVTTDPTVRALKQAIASTGGEAAAASLQTADALIAAVRTAKPCHNR